jgi:hypothetical protein
MANVELTPEEVAFLLWTLGHMYGVPDRTSNAGEINPKRDEYIEKHHNTLLPKLIAAHEA